MMFEPLRLHPLAIWLQGLRYLREMLVLLILTMTTVIVRGSGIDGYLIGTISTAALFAAIAFASGLVTWLRFRYWVDGQQLRIERGLFIRKKQYLHVDRIQSLDYAAGILHRMTNTVKVTVKSAGEKGTEAILPAITRAQANDLHRMLRKRRSKPGTFGSGPNEHEFADPEQPPEESQDAAPASLSTEAVTVYDNEEPVTYQYNLPFHHLFFAGMTSAGIGVSFSLIVALFFRLDDVFPGLQFYDPARFAVGVLLAILLILLLISWAISVTTTIFRYYGFRLERRGKDLKITRGLLEKREITIPRRRIQAVRIVDEIFRQPFGMVTLYVDSAGSGVEDAGSTMLLPLVWKQDVQTILAAVLPDQFLEPAELQVLPKRARISYMLRSLWPFVVGIPIAFYYLDLWGWVVAGIGLLTLLWTELRYRDGACSCSAGLIQLRWRQLHRTQVLIPKLRIQSIHAEQSPFQRRSGLATTIVQVASPGLSRVFSLLGVSAASAFASLDWLRRERTGVGEEK